MRPFAAIAAATAREVASSPLSMLLTLSAAAAAALAPYLHVHQFGEPARMARDASLSAMLVFGAAYAACGAAGAMRHDAESGAVQTALSLAVGRGTYFAAKLAGVCVAYLLFAATLAFAGFSAVLGAEAGGEIAAACGGLARPWGPALAAGAAAVAGPPVAAAFLDRFFSFRFSLSAARLQPVFAAVGAATVAALSLHAWTGPAASATKFLPAALLAAIPALVFIPAAAAAATRLRDGAANAVCVLLFALSLPALGGYCLSDALSKGGSIPPAYLAAAAAAALPAFLAFAFLGAALFNEKDFA